MTQIGESVDVAIMSTVDDEDTDWIAFRLIRADNKRGVTYEPFVATLTNSSQDGRLGGNGSVNFYGLPSGTCSIKFNEFYKGMTDWADERLS